MAGYVQYPKEKPYVQNLLQNKNIIVTGGSTGIGLESARGLAEMGASVWIVGRNELKSKIAVEDIKQSTGNDKVDYFIADLSSIASIKDVSRLVQSKLDHLDVLLNNAGAIFMTRKLSVDGFEMSFALNHINYFLFTKLLLDLLKSTPKARIVNVSSSAHYSGHINFSDLQSIKYSPMRAYSASKLMNVLFSYELARRLAGSEIAVNALHPGFVASNFGKSNGGIMIPIFKLVHLAAIDCREGAKTNIFLASSPEVEGITGRFFNKSKAVKSSKESYDQSVALRLWDETDRLIAPFA
jgi:NAD(P)-dependent dehydrogenase (short-subunit alcohol dehydrogenase family)